MARSYRTRQTRCHSNGRRSGRGAGRACDGSSYAVLPLTLATAPVAYRFGAAAVGSCRAVSELYSAVFCISVLQDDQDQECPRAETLLSARTSWPSSLSSDSFFGQGK